VPDDSLPWAEPAFPWGGNKNPGDPVGLQTEGFFALPSVGSTVWVGFDGGFIGRPVWLGSWLKLGELPEEVTDPRYIRLMKTPGGHLLIFDDTPGQTRILLATLSQDSGGTPHTVRFLELNDQTKKVTLRNTDNVGSDPRSLELDANSKKSTLSEGPNRKLELDQTLQKNTLQQKVLQTIVQDGTLNKTTITDGTHTITLDTLVGTITISAMGGAATIVLTAAAVTITVGGITMTFDGVTGNADVATAGNILLGTGSTQGVCLDSLISVIIAMVGVYNGHTHGASPGPSAPMVPPVLGVNSSSTVKAKL
jgi:hypothetical protein